MNIPSREECFKLWDKYGVPQGVRNHILAVNKVAVFLARKISENGINANVNLVDRAALLHDLLRVCDFKEFANENSSYEEIWEKLSAFSKIPINHDYKEIWRRIIEKYKEKHHADAAYLELKENYSEVAKVVRKHNFMRILDSKDGLKNLEEKIVYYADKVVAHDKIVGLDERREDALARSSSSFSNEKSKRGNLAFQKVKELESELCSLAKINPKKLEDLN